MAYLGQFSLGATVPLYLGTHDANLQLVLPDTPPGFTVFNGTTVVESHQMPIIDRYVLTGFFRSTLFLGRLYSTGMYQVVYNYKAGTYLGMETDQFTVVGGGDVRGAAVSTYFFDRPEAQYIVQGLESGSIIKGRNPTV